MKKSIIFVLSFVILLGMVGCTSNNTIKNEMNENSNSQVTKNNDSHYPVTITTYNYKKEPVEIKFNKAPEKVVAIYQNSIETLLELGLEDKIIASAGLDHDVKDKYKDAFSKVNYLNEFTPSKEAIIMQQPDFILSWYSIFDDKQLGDVDYWHKNNINTYMSLNSGLSENRTIENEVTDILNLGKIFNVEDKAKVLVDKINSSVKETKESIKNKKQETTLIIEYSDEKISTYGKKQLAGDMVTQLGAKLLNEQGGNISNEDLINLNPDSIFVVYMDRLNENVAKEEVNKVLQNKALSSLSAVKNKRVYPIALGEMYSSGIRTIDGINTFANGLYPNLN